MYLHKAKEAFRNLLEEVAEKTGRPVTVIEKDYYVTLILRQLSERLENCVFKGGAFLLSMGSL